MKVEEVFQRPSADRADGLGRGKVDERHDQIDCFGTASLHRVLDLDPSVHVSRESIGPLFAGRPPVVAPVRDDELFHTTSQLAATAQASRSFQRVQDRS